MLRVPYFNPICLRPIKQANFVGGIAAQYDCTKYEYSWYEVSYRYEYLLPALPCPGPLALTCYLTYPEPLTDPDSLSSSSSSRTITDDIICDDDTGSILYIIIN